MQYRVKKNRIRYFALFTLPITHTAHIDQKKQVDNVFGI
jgi:hypothetical protein